jgi:hypothetical protein
LIKYILKLNNVEQRFASAYHPQAMGKVERTNGTIIRILRSELNGHTSDWASRVRLVQFVYNTKISSVTGSTPFSLMFGRQALAKGDKKDASFNLEKWLEQQQHLIDVVYPAIEERRKEKFEKLKQIF